METLLKLTEIIYTDGSDFVENTDTLIRYKPPSPNKLCDTG